MRVNQFQTKMLFSLSMIPDSEFDANLLDVLRNICPPEMVDYFYQFAITRINQVQAETQALGIVLPRQEAFRIVTVTQGLLANMDPENPHNIRMIFREL